MLAQLSTLKSRLQILDTDTTYDSLLTSAIQAMSARFDRETSRTLARPFLSERTGWPFGLRGGGSVPESKNGS